MSFDTLCSWLDIQRDEQTEEEAEDAEEEEESLDENRSEPWASVDAAGRPSRTSIDLPDADVDRPGHRADD